MSDIVAEGVWCVECEVFEQADMIGELCMACGCVESAHATARVETL